jgi:hypothetical protein
MQDRQFFDFESPSKKAPESAARALAELAFAPAPHEQGPAPQVIVRRRRIQLPLLAPEKAADDAQTHVPRVFLARQPLVGVENTEATAGDPGPVAADVTEAPVRRSERIGHEKRARTLRVVLVEPPADRVPAAVAQPGAEADAAIARAMAGLQSTLTQIGQAQDFTLVDDSLDGEWQGLAAAAQRLERDLQSVLAEPAR